jgi:tripartite ATP-independent transporter DctM subunit
VFLLLGSILLGAPIMLALTVVGFVGIIILSGFTPAVSILGTLYFSVVSSFHFSIIPMFLLMGFFAMRAGIGNDLFDACTKWFGRLPGGLAIASTGAAAAFGAASGSSVGTATLFTKLALPEMIQRGYDRGFAAASIAIAGTLAVLIPPSALVVVYGILTNSSIGKLLIAGILPGVVFALILGATILLVAIMKPETPLSARKRAKSSPPMMMAKIIAVRDTVSRSVLPSSILCKPRRRTTAMTKVTSAPMPPASVGVNTPA